VKLKQRQTSTLPALHGEFDELPLATLNSLFIKEIWGCVDGKSGVATDGIGVARTLNLNAPLLFERWVLSCLGNCPAWVCQRVMDEPLTG
jgi:hypothetical protein